MVCMRCGAWVPEEDRYCGKCGARRDGVPFQEEEKEGVLFPLRDGSERIFPVEDIHYFEHMQRNTVIYCAEGVYRTGLRLSEIEQLLPEGRFCRPHISYLVRLGWVKQVGRREILLLDGARIPASRSRAAAFLTIWRALYQKKGEKKA